MDFKNAPLFAQGNTAEIFSLDETRVLKLYKKGMGKQACERE